MKISEHIEMMQAALAEHGDIEVVGDNYGAGYAALVVDVEVETWPCVSNGDGVYVKQETKVLRLVEDESQLFSSHEG